MAESLNDRFFEAFRRVSPGRKVVNRKDVALHSEEYAIAVIGTDGQSVGLDTGNSLRGLYELLEEQNLLLMLIAVKLGADIPIDILPQTAGSPVPMGGTT